MKVTTDFNLNTGEWGEAFDANMGARIETAGGVIYVNTAHDGSLSIRAQEGFLMVVPMASNAVVVMPKNTRDASPFSAAI